MIVVSRAIFMRVIGRIVMCRIDMCGIISDREFFLCVMRLMFVCMAIIERMAVLPFVMRMSVVIAGRPGCASNR